MRKYGFSEAFLTAMAREVHGQALVLLYEAAELAEVVKKGKDKAAKLEGVKQDERSGA